MLVSATVFVATMLFYLSFAQGSPRTSDLESTEGFGATLPALQAPSASPTPATAATPRSVVIPTSGNGRFNVAQGASTPVGSGRLVEYQVEVEDDLPVEAKDFARIVDETLGDSRGWTKGGQFEFQRKTGAPLRIVLASPSTTDKLCAPLRTRGELSCRNGNVVAINATRWIDGADSYEGDVERYRQYVVNHEVGHGLGFGHEACPAPGRKASVMLQQTLGLHGCLANPWP